MLKKLVIWISLLSLMGSACEDVQKKNKDMKKTVLTVVSQEDYISWDGNIEELSLTMLKEQCIGELGERNVLVGSQSQYMKIYVCPSIGLNIGFGFLDEKPKKITIEFPNCSYNKITKEWGDPDIQLPYYYDILEVEKGEKVYLKKGLSFKLTPEETSVYEITLFAPCSEEDFMRYIYETPQPPIVE